MDRDAEFCQNFEEETGRIKPGLDPINSPVKDETAMNLLRPGIPHRRCCGLLGSTEGRHVTDRHGTLARGHAPLNEIPDRVQEWKKSSARCGADVALSLVRVHCKEVRQDKLAAIKVANTQKHDFRTFMETFIAAATRIADGVDLDEFVEPASPPPAE